MDAGEKDGYFHEKDIRSVLLLQNTLLSGQTQNQVHLYVTVTLPGGRDYDLAIQVLPDGKNPIILSLTPVQPPQG